MSEFREVFMMFYIQVISVILGTIFVLDFTGPVWASIDRGALSVASRGFLLLFRFLRSAPVAEGGADRKNPNSNKKPLEATDRAPRSRASKAKQVHTGSYMVGICL